MNVDIEDAFEHFVNVKSNNISREEGDVSERSFEAGWQAALKQVQYKLWDGDIEITELAKRRLTEKILSLI